MRLCGPAAPVGIPVTSGRTRTARAVPWNVSGTGVPVPGRGFVGCLMGLAIRPATGFDNWTPEQPVPVLFNPDSLRLPWRTWAWMPVWGLVSVAGQDVA